MKNIKITKLFVQQNFPKGEYTLYGLQKYFQNKFNVLIHTTTLNNLCEELKQEEFIDFYPSHYVRGNAVPMIAQKITKDYVKRKDKVIDMKKDILKQLEEQDLNVPKLKSNGKYGIEGSTLFDTKELKDTITKLLNYLENRGVIKIKK